MSIHFHSYTAVSRLFCHQIQWLWNQPINPKQKQYFSTVWNENPHFVVNKDGRRSHQHKKEVITHNSIIPLHRTGMCNLKITPYNN